MAGFYSARGWTIPPLPWPTFPPPISDDDYTPPFALTAKLNMLKIKIDRPQLTKADVDKLENAQAIAVDGRPIHNMQAGPQ